MSFLSMNAKTALKGKKRIKNCFMPLELTNSYGFSIARYSKFLFSFLSVEALHCHQEHWKNRLFKTTIQQGICKATSQSDL